MAKIASNPEQLQAWQKALEALVTQIQGWCEARHWLHHRASKTLRESAWGAYEVPVLTIQTNQGRIHFEPAALDVVGAVGRVDMYAWPALDEVMLIDFDQGWRVLDMELPPAIDMPWSEQAFEQVARHLTAPYDPKSDKAA